jgi:predicted membrane-bound mannosyltransferase
MRLTVSVIGVFGLLALVLVGAVWTVVAITPVGVFATVAIFIVVRSKRRQAAIADALSRAADRERELNRQEFAAWREFAEEERQREARRQRALRKFDSTRDPPR